MTFPALLAIVGVALLLLWRWSSSANEHAEEVMQLAAQDESGVRSLIAQGEKIAAIKLARKITGLDLKASKELIESLRRDPRIALPGRAVIPPADTVAARDPEIRGMIARGDTIAAIERWRELTGDSLVEAKRAVVLIKER